MSPDTSARGRGRWARLALAAAVLLVAAELVLQAASRLGDSGAGEPQPPELDGAELVVLCCGDGAVFGLHQTPASAYPGYLQRLLDERAATGVRVANLGAPRLSSRQAARELPAQLERWRPELVLWTAGAEGGDGARAAGRGAPLDGLRLVHAARGVLRHFGPEQASAAGFPTREGERVARSPAGEGAAAEGDLRADLVEVRASCERAGARLVLVGYAADGPAERAASDALARLADELELPFVDPRPAVAELQARIGREPLFYDRSSPRAPAHEVVARCVLNGLADGGLLDVERLHEPASAVAVGGPGRAQIDVEPSPDGGLRVALSGGPPGRAFLLLFWSLRDAGETYSPAPLAELLKRDPLLARMVESGPRARFDDEGSARVTVFADAGERALAALSGRTVQASYALLDSEGEIGEVAPHAPLRIP
ncbi:MAG: hypothetical protein AAF682_17855 [Planctomycetota bacterium]